jgi:hypothetical protein
MRDISMSLPAQCATGASGGAIAVALRPEAARVTTSFDAPLAKAVYCEPRWPWKRGKPSRRRVRDGGQTADGTCVTQQMVAGEVDPPSQIKVASSATISLVTIWRQ